MDLQIANNWKELAKPIAETVLKPGILEIKTDSGLFILKTKNEKQELRKSLYLLQAIRREDVPIEVPVESLSGELYVDHGNKRYCLFERIVGDPINTGFEHINWEIFGNAIARLHLAFDKIAIDIAFPEMQFVDAFPWLTGGKRQSVLSCDYLSYLSDSLAKIEALQKELIHRDPHPGNIIFKDGKLAGFIDLDLSTMGPRIFDLVYCSTAMLSDLFSGQREVWVYKRKEIVVGYQRLCHLSDLELSLLLPMAVYIQQLFTRFYENQRDDEKSAHNAMIAKWLFESNESRPMV
ncbi:MAG: hypothetical protein CMN78_05640 [Spirochaetales bacterium]|nr:hypothetical protein [Spirochaetales bacterium]